MTLFQDIYDNFLGRITDDMYMEYTPRDTKRDCQSLLISAISSFEFPRFNIFDYNLHNVEENDKGDFVDRSCFNADLSLEEITILAILMMIEWLNRQIHSCENIRQKYSSADFKFTSQAAHLAQLQKLQEENFKRSTHLQRLYKRRIHDTDTNRIKSNWSNLFRKNVGNSK